MNVQPSSRGFVARSIQHNGRAVQVETARKVVRPALAPLLAAAEAVFVQRDAPLARATSHPNAYPGGLVDFVRDGDVVLTAEQAGVLAAHCVHQIQTETRPLTRPDALHHISVLRSLMTGHGTWRPRDQLRFGLLHGLLWILDGNHRMVAQYESGCDIEWNIVIFACEDEDDLRQMFNKFNTNERDRTEAQILTATGFAKDAGITRTMATAVFSAMPFIDAGFRTGKSSSDVLKSRIFDTRIKSARAFSRQAKLLDECLKGGDSRIKKKLLGGGVTAVALVTLKNQEEIATEFWRGVAKNDGLSKGDPRHTLVMDLLTRAMNSGASHQSISAPAAAWNAFYAGRKLHHIKVLETDAVKIAGTPFAGA